MANLQQFKNFNRLSLIGPCLHTIRFKHLSALSSGIGARRTLQTQICQVVSGGDGLVSFFPEQTKTSRVTLPKPRPRGVLPLAVAMPEMTEFFQKQAQECRRSQETLAEMIGTTRSRVSFFMNKFRELGLIDYNGGIEVHSSLLNVVLHDQPQIKT